MNDVGKNAINKMKDGDFFNVAEAGAISDTIKVKADIGALHAEKPDEWDEIITIVPDEPVEEVMGAELVPDEQVAVVDAALTVPIVEEEHEEARETYLPKPLEPLWEEKNLLSPGGCFGAETAKFQKLLKEFIMDELWDAEYYRILAQRAPTNVQRQMMRKFSQDERRHAKRFAAAYFLATGFTYLPQPAFPDLRVPPYKLALRERFLEEKAAAEKYRDLAEKVDDRCLKNLLNEILKDEERHASLIQGILEDMDE